MHWEEVLKSARRKLKFKIFKESIIGAANEQGTKFYLDRDFLNRVSELYVQKYKEEFGNLRGTNRKILTKVISNNQFTIGHVLKNIGFTSYPTRLNGQRITLYRRNDEE